MLKHGAHTSQYPEETSPLHGRHWENRIREQRAGEMTRQPWPLLISRNRAPLSI